VVVDISLDCGSSKSSLKRINILINEAVKLICSVFKPEQGGVGLYTISARFPWVCMIGCHGTQHNSIPGQSFAFHFSSLAFICLCYI